MTSISCFWDNCTASDFQDEEECYTHLVNSHSIVGKQSCKWIKYSSLAGTTCDIETKHRGHFIEGCSLTFRNRQDFRRHDLNYPEHANTLNNEKELSLPKRPSKVNLATLKKNFNNTATNTLKKNWYPLPFHANNTNVVYTETTHVEKRNRSPSSTHSHAYGQGNPSRNIPSPKFHSYYQRVTHQQNYINQHPHSHPSLQQQNPCNCPQQYPPAFFQASSQTPHHLSTRSGRRHDHLQQSSHSAKHFFSNVNDAYNYPPISDYCDDTPVLPPSAIPFSEVGLNINYFKSYCEVLKNYGLTLPSNIFELINTVSFKGGKIPPMIESELQEALIFGKYPQISLTGLMSIFNHAVDNLIYDMFVKKILVESQELFYSILKKKTSMVNAKRTPDKSVLPTNEMLTANIPEHSFNLIKKNLQKFLKIFWKNVTEKFSNDDQAEFIELDETEENSQRNNLISNQKKKHNLMVSLNITLLQQISKVAKKIRKKFYLETVANLESSLINRFDFHSSGYHIKIYLSFTHDEKDNTEEKDFFFLFLKFGQDESWVKSLPLERRFRVHGFVL
ncbi:hypothetical protein HK099_001610 [Clydaea vesicula]|uniref:Uncharacterized protein n=1 Tax=Clydaea vesicula TaxID=447962 RepID=A0AAD5TW66_9FUNG|nr:hypothetical protein HK099_001610 [Clydaea vesicula]